MKFDGKEYVFRATSDYGIDSYLRRSGSKLTRADEGEEVYMSYGPHPNDFLFAECKLYLY